MDFDPSPESWKASRMPFICAMFIYFKALHDVRVSINYRSIWLKIELDQAAIDFA